MDSETGGKSARHNRMFEGIETIRALWRGESREAPGGDGKPVTFMTRPRPVQAELPVWVTAGGSPETFRRAGEIGAGGATPPLGGLVRHPGGGPGPLPQGPGGDRHPGPGGEGPVQPPPLLS